MAIFNGYVKLPESREDTGILWMLLELHTAGSYGAMALG